MNDNLSPKNSPSGLFVNPKNLGITRINKRIIGILFVIFGGASIILLATISSHGKRVNAQIRDEKKLSEAKVTTATPPQIKEMAAAKSQLLPNADNQTTVASLDPDSRKQDLKDDAEFKREIKRYRHQQQIAKLQREDAGFTASMEVKASLPPVESSKLDKNDAGIGADASPLGRRRVPEDLLAASLADKDPNLQGRKESFFNEQISSNYLPHKKVNPLSPNEIKQGTVIPGVMISGINSDLPGQIIGQVSQTVYDTATGKIPLIPQGARLVGSYDSFVAVGQEAAMIAWRRIIFPDGTSIDLLNMPGTDEGGYSGFRDQVNNHYFKIFGSALMLSLVGAGYQISQTEHDGRTFPSNQEILASEVGRQFAQVSNEMIKRNMQIQPTIEIRPGYRFNIMVNKDMILAPYLESQD